MVAQNILMWLNSSENYISNPTECHVFSRFERTCIWYDPSRHGCRKCLNTCITRIISWSDLASQLQLMTGLFFDISYGTVSVKTQPLLMLFQAEQFINYIMQVFYLRAHIEVLYLRAYLRQSTKIWVVQENARHALFEDVFF